MSQQLPAEVLEAIGKLEKSIVEQGDALTAHIKQANGEIAELGKSKDDTIGKLEELAEKMHQAHGDLQALEQKHAEYLAEGALRGDIKTIGRMFTEGDEFAALVKSGRGTATMKLDGQGIMDLSEKAIVNATLNNDQPLVQSQRVPGIVQPVDRRMTVRDFLPIGQTSTNLIEFARELVFTNAAAIQAAEGDLKAESNITFALANAPVRTIAHWIAASKQVLEDAPMLRSYIDGRLMYGLKLKEEDQLLNGDGTGSNIDGLLNQATGYTGVVTDSRADQLRRAMNVVQLSEYDPSLIVMHPTDWMEIELAKDADLQYYLGGPGRRAAPMLWGLPVVTTQSIAAGTYMVGAFNVAAQIWDREQASISFSTENSDNFVKNMCTILCEERIALTVYRPASFVGTTFVTA